MNYFNMLVSNMSKVRAKVGTRAVAKSPVKRGKGVAIFIDLDNTGASVANLVEVFSHLRGIGNVVYAKVYGYTDAHVNEFEEFIAENRLETIGKMRFKPDTSVVDTRLVVDAIRLTIQHKFDTVFVWAGLGDLSSLFQHLQELGAKTAAVDSPDLDTQNKFIHQRIKLFSGYQFGVSKLTAPVISQPIPEAMPVMDAPTDKAIAPKAILPKIDLFASHTAPALPRRTGAPEFGTKENESAFQEPPVSSDPDGPISVDQLPQIFDTLPEDKRIEAAALPRDKRQDLEVYLQAQEMLAAINSEVTEEKRAESFTDDFGDLGIKEEPKPEPTPKQEVPPSPKPVPAPTPPKSAKTAKVSDDMFDDFGTL